LYGCETWTIKKEVVDKLNAFEMWVWRRMEKVSWQDKKMNEEILTAVGEERCIVQAILKRKQNWIGHVMRGDSLLKLVIEGRMLGKKPSGNRLCDMLSFGLVNLVGTSFCTVYMYMCAARL